MAIELPGWTALPTPAPAGLLAKWEAVKDATLPPIAGLHDPATVHAFVRQHVSYIVDNIDEWSAPADTLSRGYGDCEDYVFLERALLRAAGWSKPIYVLLVYDIIARLDHALLVTNGIFLDNRTPRIQPLATFSDYRPIIAFSDDEILTFGRKRKV